MFQVRGVKPLTTDDANLIEQLGRLGVQLGDDGDHLVVVFFRAGEDQGVRANVHHQIDTFAFHDRPPRAGRLDGLESLLEQVLDDLADPRGVGVLHLDQTQGELQRRRGTIEVADESFRQGQLLRATGDDQRIGADVGLHVDVVDQGLARISLRHGTLSATVGVLRKRLRAVEHFFEKIANRFGVREP